eukprot:m.232450 g.232450  ORF g.232450 m.232450 type:complete len:1296 (+) comp26062_c0_seq1:2398-6285(+)
MGVFKRRRVSESPSVSGAPVSAQSSNPKKWRACGCGWVGCGSQDSTVGEGTGSVTWAMNDVVLVANAGCMSYDEASRSFHSTSERKIRGRWTGLEHSTVSCHFPCASTAQNLARKLVEASPLRVGDRVCVGDNRATQIIASLPLGESKATLTGIPQAVGLSTVKLAAATNNDTWAARCEDKSSLKWDADFLAEQVGKGYITESEKTQILWAIKAIGLLHPTLTLVHLVARLMMKSLYHRHHFNPGFFKPVRAGDSTQLLAKQCVRKFNGDVREPRDVIRTVQQIKDGVVSRIAHPTHRHLGPLSIIERDELCRIVRTARALKAAQRTGKLVASTAMEAAVSGIVASIAHPPDDAVAEDGKMSSPSTVCPGTTLASLPEDDPTQEDVSSWNAAVTDAARFRWLYKMYTPPTNIDPTVDGVLFGRSTGQSPPGLAGTLVSDVRKAVFGADRCLTHVAIMQEVSSRVSKDVESEELSEAVWQATAYVINHPIAILRQESADASGMLPQSVFRCPTCDTSCDRVRCGGCQYVRKILRRRVLLPTTVDRHTHIAKMVANGTLVAEVTRLREQLEAEELKVEAQAAVIAYQAAAITALEEQIAGALNEAHFEVVEVCDEGEGLAAFATLTAAQEAHADPSTDGDPIPANLLDGVCPPNSTLRAFWDANYKNMESRVRTNSTRGARYSTQIHQLALVVLSRAGTSCYEKLAAALPSLPSSRTLRRYRGNLPTDEWGPLNSQWETMNLLFSGVHSTKSDHQWDRTGCVAFDEQYVAKFVEWDVATSRLTGLVDEDFDLAVIGQELERELEEKGGATSVTHADCFATRHLVFFWTSLGGITNADGDSVAFHVGRWATAGASCDRLADQLRAVIRTGHSYGFSTAAVSCDGAAENIAVMSMLMKADGASASEFIPEDIRTSRPQLDFDWKVAFRDEVTGEPIFFIPDAPHLLKKLRNSLWSSGRSPTLQVGEVDSATGLQKEKSRDANSRDLKMPVDHDGPVDVLHSKWDLLSLRMLEHVVHCADNRSVGQHRLHQHQIRNEHFHLSNSSKMRVSLAAQVLSSTMGRLIEEFMADDALSRGADMRNLPPRGNYQSLLDFVQVVDEWFDVTNTASEKGHHPISLDIGPSGDAGRAELNTLLDTLDYFEGWRSALASAGLSEKERKCSFITDEQWCEMRWLCLGEVSLCQYYLEGHPDRRVVLRRLQSDVVEHHFGSRRGIQRGVVARGCIAGNNRADQAGAANRAGSFVVGANCVRSDSKDAYGNPIEMVLYTKDKRERKRNHTADLHNRVITAMDLDVPAPQPPL